MHLYYKIIYLLLNKEYFDKYKDAIVLEEIKYNGNPVIYKLFISLFHLYEKTNKSDNSVEDLHVVYKSLYPGDNEKEMELVFNKIFREGSEANKDLLVSYLKEIKGRQVAFQLAKFAIEVSDGSKTLTQFAEALGEARKGLDEAEAVKEEVVFVSDNLEELYNKNVKERGLRWRLNSLNKTLGSLRKGDFGFVFARPETGKTTWIACEATYMASQLTDEDGPILWFNNEEQGDKVMLRCYQAALDKTMQELSLDLKENNKKYHDLIKNKIKIFDKDKIYKAEVESLTNNCRPSLIIFDQIDKIEGFEADREDLKLGEIYKWARSLAKRYCPVIGICQADGTGEGIKALNMSHVANAKTAKQAEADFILGIGKSHNKDEQIIRYFNISKNKLFGDDDSDPARKHDLWEVEIDPHRARYRDFVYHDDYNNPRPTN